jgi:acetyl-CoA synthetase
MANVLREQGVEKEIVYLLPMIPELAIATLPVLELEPYILLFSLDFSASAVTRINDSDCKMVITSDGGYRGNKTIDLKGIIDDALVNTPCVANVLVVRTNSTINMKEGRDCNPLDEASDNNTAEIMDAEDPLFILYTSGSTGNPEVHTTAGYMVYTAYTFKNVFNYEDNDIFCTADIGWITGHSYILSVLY